MEKTYKVLYAESVFNDFEEISSIYLTHIMEKVELLDSFPELGIAIESPNWKGYRQIIVDFYRILYTVDLSKKFVTIHFAKHGKMNFQ